MSRNKTPKSILEMTLGKLKRAPDGTYTIEVYVTAAGEWQGGLPTEAALVLTGPGVRPPIAVALQNGQGAHLLDNLLPGYSYQVRLIAGKRMAPSKIIEVPEVEKPKTKTAREIEQADAEAKFAEAKAKRDLANLKAEPWVAGIEKNNLLVKDRQARLSVAEEDLKLDPEVRAQVKAQHLANLRKGAAEAEKAVRDLAPKIEPPAKLTVSVSGWNGAYTLAISVADTNGKPVKDTGVVVVNGGTIEPTVTTDANGLVNFPVRIREKSRFVEVRANGLVWSSALPGRTR